MSKTSPTRPTKTRRIHSMEDFLKEYFPNRLDAIIDAREEGNPEEAGARMAEQSLSALKTSLTSKLKK